MKYIFQQSTSSTDYYKNAKKVHKYQMKLFANLESPKLEALLIVCTKLCS